MKSVDLILILFIVDKAYFTCRVDVGFSVKPTSLRVLLRVRTTSNLKLEKNLTSSKSKALRSSFPFLRLVNPIVYTNDVDSHLRVLHQRLLWSKRLARFSKPTFWPLLSPRVHPCYVGAVGKLT
jgi:hypothetical protein